MASLRETQRGNFIVCFRHQGQQYQRALKTNVEGLFISEHHLAQFFLAHGLLFPDAKRLTTLLSTAGALRERRDGGWLVPYGWFIEKFAKKKTPKRKLSSRTGRGRT